MSEYVPLCATCATPVDPESHLLNAQTREQFCSSECWCEATL
jgi:hypothetical protein